MVVAALVIACIALVLSLTALAWVADEWMKLRAGAVVWNEEICRLSGRPIPKPDGRTPFGERDFLGLFNGSSKQLIARARSRS